jgi:hypothetical protein
VDDDAAPNEGGMTHRPILAVPALFSGVALLLYLIGGVDLRLALGATIAIATGGGVALMRGASPSERRAVARAVIVGALAGVIGTAVYDGSRAALSALDPSPFNPFHAIHAFGELLVGPAASEGSIVAAGTAFHLLNGTMFAIAYTFLFARDGETSLRRALASGLIWGLFLETFQITLYPGWLDIRAYNEFLAISALGHLVYGLSLGAITRTLLRAHGRGLLSRSERSGWPPERREEVRDD